MFLEIGLFRSFLKHRTSWKPHGEDNELGQCFGREI